MSPPYAAETRRDLFNVPSAHRRGGCGFNIYLWAERLWKVEMAMSDVFLRYPGGLDKAVTLSYDDGRKTDLKLLEILDSYGLRCTFNIAPEFLAEEGDDSSPYLKKSDIVRLFKDSVHEVALHGYSHPFFDLLPNGIAAYELVKSREELERLLERPIRGMAYPNGPVAGEGKYTDELVRLVKDCGIAYARTTENVEHFRMCGDWLRMGSTCHHNDPELMPLAKRFAETRVDRIPRLFAVWGHSFEFERDNNWSVMEELCGYLSSRNDIWFTTCIELRDYAEAYERLKFSVDGTRVFNPSCMTVYIMKNGVTAEIKPGETVKI